MLSCVNALLSTHADRKGVDISFTVCLFVCICLFVCTVTADFSAEDKASGVKFCTAVHRRSRQEIAHFCELCSPKAQIGRIGKRAGHAHPHVNITVEMRRRKRHAIEIDVDADDDRSSCLVSATELSATVCVRYGDDDVVLL